MCETPAGKARQGETPQVRRRRGGSRPPAESEYSGGWEIQRLKIVLTLKRLNKVFFCFFK